MGAALVHCDGTHTTGEIVYTTASVRMCEYTLLTKPYPLLIAAALCQVGCGHRPAFGSGLQRQVLLCSQNHPVAQYGTGHHRQRYTGGCGSVGVV